jgi:hypothetical protein
MLLGVPLLHDEGCFWLIKIQRFLLRTMFFWRYKAVWTIILAPGPRVTLQQTTGVTMTKLTGPEFVDI